MNTYTTTEVAKIIGIHPNTVRMYEEWGLIEKAKRKENAKEAETLSRKFFEKDTKDTTTWKRAEAAKELLAMIREMNRKYF